MFRRWTSITVLLICAVGCRTPDDYADVDVIAPADLFSGRTIEQPDADVLVGADVLGTAPPRTLRRSDPPEDWPLKLDDAIRIALASSKVMRDIDGRIVSSPTTASTVFDPARQQTNPQRGPQAALSEFDALVTTGAFAGKNSRATNDLLILDTQNALQRNDGAFFLDLSKTAATGTRLGIRHVIQYDRANTPADLFARSWDAYVEAEFRHPLALGGGIEFNRIAGPGATPGRYNGVVIGRVNTDISLADFEFAVRNLLAEVERTYWELYFAWRDHEAKVAARDEALTAWKEVQGRVAMGLTDARREAFSRERYYDAQLDVEHSLNGMPARRRNHTLTGTPTNALLGGMTGGIYAIERRLRYLIGLSPSDGKLIRPVDPPLEAEIAFDWHESLVLGISRRVELRKQKWVIKRSELELIAARNFLRSQVDLVGQYRFRGFSDELSGTAGTALPQMFSGDEQEWQFGVQMVRPIGNRIGSTAVRQAELNLAREKAIYREQEHQVAHELNAAFGELDHAWATTRTNFNRFVAAQQQIAGLLEQYRQFGEHGQHGVRLETIFETQRRSANARAAWHRSLVDYNLAIANIHFARGTTLDYLRVYLSESGWSAEALHSALEQARRLSPHLSNYTLDKPRPVSSGEFRQRVLGTPLEIDDPAATTTAPRPAAVPARRPHRLLPPMLPSNRLDRSPPARPEVVDPPPALPVDPATGNFDDEYYRPQPRVEAVRNNRPPPPGRVLYSPTDVPGRTVAPVLIESEWDSSRPAPIAVEWQSSRVERAAPVRWIPTPSQPSAPETDLNWNSRSEPDGGIPVEFRQRGDVRRANDQREDRSWREDSRREEARRVDGPGESIHWRSATVPEPATPIRWGSRSG